MKTKRQRVSRVVRRAVLGATTAFFLFFSTLISEHAICPIGGFELFFTGLFGTGLTLAGLLSGMTLVFIVMSVLSIVFRRAYCGYVCPMGALQEFSHIVGRRVLPKKIRGLRVPGKVDRALRWLKYPVLASFVAGAALVGTHWMIPGDPFMVMMHLVQKGGIAGSWARMPFALIFFIAIIAFAFVFGRGFCRYICPAGAWYAILSRVSPTRIVRHGDWCIGCGACSSACPMGIDVKSSRRVASAECIGCGECANACPAKGALSYKFAPVDVPSVLVPAAAAAVFSASVACAVSSMPARGSRPEGNARIGNPAEKGTRAGTGESGTGENRSGSAIDSGSGGAAAAAVDGRGLLGGCASCSGCGFCARV